MTTSLAGAFASFPFAAGPFAATGALMAATAASAAPASGAKAPKITDGDYVRDAAGNLVDSDAIDEEVAYLLATIAGTVPGESDTGNAVSSIRMWTDKSIVEISNAVTLALTPTIRRGAITDVIVVPEPTMLDESRALAAYSVRYTKTGKI